MKREIMLTCRDNGTTVKLPAMARIYGMFAVHKSFDITDSAIVFRGTHGTWDVTHIPTGLHMDGASFDKCNSAIVFAKWLDSFGMPVSDSLADTLAAFRVYLPKEAYLSKVHEL